PTDAPVTNARVSVTLWNVDVDTTLPPISKKIVASPGERVLAKIKFADEVPWIPRHSAISLTSIDLKTWGIKPGDRVMGWLSVACMDCLGTETSLLYFKAGARGLYGHLPGKEAPDEQSL